MVSAGVRPRVGGRGAPPLVGFGGVLTAAGLHRGECRGEVFRVVRDVAGFPGGLRDEGVLLGHLADGARDGRRGEVELPLRRGVRRLRVCRCALASGGGHATVALLRRRVVEVVGLLSSVVVSRLLLLLLREQGHLGVGLGLVVDQIHVFRRDGLRGRVLGCRPPDLLL